MYLGTFAREDEAIAVYPFQRVCPSIGPCPARVVRRPAGASNGPAGQLDFLIADLFTAFDGPGADFGDGPDDEWVYGTKCTPNGVCSSRRTQVGPTF